MFHRWLTAARARRHKRIILREKELELDRASVQVAWDRWRERYMDEKLRPLVSFAISLTIRTCLTRKSQLFQIAIQNQKNCLFRAFGVWHSKTRVCVTISNIWQCLTPTLLSHSQRSVSRPHEQRRNIGTSGELQCLRRFKLRKHERCITLPS